MKRIARTPAVTVAAGALALTGTVVTASGAAAAAVPRCTAAMLSAKVTDTAAGMSQPATYITVTNTGSAACRLRGYPIITRMTTKKGPRQVTVSHGGVQNAPQVPVKRIVLAPGAHAWFAIGTATAYDPPVVTFTGVRFTPSAGTAGGLTVTVSQQASAPSGKPFPVGVTAYAKGTGTAS